MPSSCSARCCAAGRCGEIARDVRLSGPLRVAFYELVASSLKAADTLATALTPVGRMETMRKRLPDEAAAFLFGPLIAAIRAEATNAVGVAIAAGAKANSPPSQVEAKTG